MQEVSTATADELFSKIAVQLAGRINETIAAEGSCILGIVGGRSMPGLLNALRTQDVQGPIYIFWLDERAGWHKNYKPLRWPLRRLRFTTQVTWYPITGLTEKTTIQQAETCYKKLMSLRDEPRFDIVIASAGEDGHVASLFPGNAALTAKNKGYVTIHNAPKPPPTRVTVTPPLLLTAEEGYLFFTGAKNEAYELFKSGASTTDCPAKFLEKLPKLTVCTALS
ncbi:MAG: 6-phosphogluconolactonase [Candidatus Woesearchaeota archaeon]|nr:6-phosphogluconolactonase [Candidatus Woesearchaeota archaeon]